MINLESEVFDNDTNNHEESDENGNAGRGNEGNEGNEEEHEEIDEGNEESNGEIDKRDEEIKRLQEQIEELQRNNINKDSSGTKANPLDDLLKNVSIL